MNKLFKLLCFAINVIAYVALLIVAPRSILTILIGLPIAIWFTNAVHEASHLIAYVALRIRWTRFSFSYWTIIRDTEGTSVKFDMNSGIYNACCTCIYDAGVPLWKYWVALLSGGVLCAIMGAVCLLLCSFVEGALWSLMGCIGVAFVLNAAGNLLIPFSPDRTLLKMIVKDRR